MCSGPCSNACLIIYLQQNGSEKRLRERARGQVYSLIAERFSCQERLCYDFLLLLLQIAGFF